LITSDMPGTVDALLIFGDTDCQKVEAKNQRGADDGRDNHD